MVACMTGGHEAASSSLVTPTIYIEDCFEKFNFSRQSFVFPSTLLNIHIYNIICMTMLANIFPDIIPPVFQNSPPFTIM